MTGSRGQKTTAAIAIANTVAGAIQIARGRRGVDTTVVGAVADAVRSKSGFVDAPFVVTSGTTDVACCEILLGSP